MALQLLPILQVMVILCMQSSYTYPVYGTKRYGRSSHRISAPTYSPYQPMVRNQRYPINYYELYPYSQSYPEDYYYLQDSYPMYYPARTSKYEVYQAVLPYYYGDRPVVRPGYGYYDADPVTDLQEKMIQEVEREEREDSQPIGQEMLYENEGIDDNLDDEKATFVEDLVMSQLYKNALNDPKAYDSSYYTDYYPINDGSLGKWADTPVEPQQSYSQEDEDVKELKQLAKPKSKQNQDVHWFKSKKFRNQNSWEKKSYSDLEDQIAEIRLPEQVPTSIAPPTTTEVKGQQSGQKEEMLARPATPVRRPYSTPMMQIVSKAEDERKRSPSVYDTIKHMLDMEKNLENVSTINI